MPYRVVYDVLDDAVLPAHTQELLFLGGALLWLTVWVVLTRAVPQLRAKNLTRPGVVIGALFLIIGMVMVAGSTYATFADQRRCREWLRTRDHQTAEGPVAGFKHGVGRDPPTTFRVGNTLFEYRREAPKTGGFRGSFTAESVQLRDGLQVRIAHRDGRILRIEVAE